MLRVLAKQRKGLNICHINAQSLASKIEEFRYLFVKPETWFAPQLSDVLVSCDGFNLYRSCERGAIYTNKKLTTKVFSKHSAGGAMEHLFLHITGRKIHQACS